MAIKKSKKVSTNVLTNTRIAELTEEWKMMYENPAMRDVVISNIQSITDKVLSGELIVEKA